MSEKAYVYKITNLVNNKIYIGKTAEENPIIRFNNHKCCAVNGYNDCPKLYNSMRAHGIDNFKFEIVEEFEAETKELAEQKALNAEALYIKLYDSKKNGLNVSLGGDSPIYGENNPMYGKGYLIAGNKNGMYGRVGKQNPFYGKTHTDDYKLQASMRESKYSQKELEIIKQMLFDGSNLSDIRKIYPEFTDEMCSHMRAGTRWAWVLPELKLKSKFKQLTLEQAQEIYDTWKDGNYKSQRAFHREVVSNLYPSLTFTSVNGIITGNAWKHIRR